MPNQTSSKKEFTVVLRGPSAAIFPKGVDLNLSDYPFPNKERGAINLRTRWITTPDGIEIPGHILILVKGNSDDDLHTTCEKFASTALSLLPSISFCSNAAVGQVEFEVGYDSTPDEESRDFFQNYLPNESYQPHNYRIIDVEPTGKFLLEKTLHNERDRLNRAVYQYHLALKHWKMNHEVICLAHLWMAVEALTKAKIRKEIKARGLKNQDDLADHMGIEIKQLDGQVRKQLLLNGDNECYKKSKEASNGFEHGYMNLGKVQKLAGDVRQRIAGYVREAILELVGLENKYKKRLLSDVLSKPLGFWPYANYLKGKLSNAKDNIAKKGNEYPYLDWEIGFKDFKIIENNSKVRFELKNKVVPQVANGADFKDTLKHEIWKQT